MEYTINKLAKLAGVTTRTLRYYDQIALLKPSHTTQAGYRIYGKKEIDKLQQILFFRELELSLEQISNILNQPEVDYLTLLEAHREALVLKNQRLTALINTIDTTIAAQKGEKMMTDKQKFDAFKHQLIEEHEAKYGQESRQKYGKERVNDSRAAMLNMSEAEYHQREANEQKLLTLLAKYPEMTVPSAEAFEIFTLHKDWLAQAWGQYKAEDHKGIGNMYVATPEFTAYYDSKAGTGATLILNKIIQHYA